MRIGRVTACLLLALVACESGSSSNDVIDGTGSPDVDVSSDIEPTPSGGTVAESDGLVCWASPPGSGDEGIVFSDQTESAGLISPLIGIYGHAAIWADLTGDGNQELFVGTFADKDLEDYQVRGAQGPSPDQLLTQTNDGFQPLSGFEEMFSRTSGGAIADLDNDGDLDLVLSRNWNDDIPDAPATQVMRNDGSSFTAVDVAGLPADFGGRSVGVIDFNADGRMDLMIVEDRWSGGRSMLLENRGDLVFADATSTAGLPRGVHGLGVAVADFTNDSFQDILVSGSNRLFVANGDGTFSEADSSVLQWEVYDDEDDVAGVSVADVNRDGLLDVLIGQHYNSTVDDGRRVPVRLYLNRGTDAGGMPGFEDVTEASGLVGLPTKAPHVELNDMDNDGWPDVVTTASASNGTRPAIFRNSGTDPAQPSFTEPQALGSPQYWVTGPTADVNRDGRLDMILIEWEPSLPSIFLQNESASGNWLQVSVGADHGFGIGWRVDIFEAGRLGDPAARLGTREITVTQGYSAGVAPVAHVGLGEASAVDIRLTAPGGEIHELSGIGANAHIRYPQGCG